MVPIPNTVWTQPLSEAHRFFPKWQCELGVCCLNAERRAFKLFLEDVAPVLMSKADILVAKGPCHGFQLPFPFCGGLQDVGALSLLCQLDVS